MNREEIQKRVESAYEELSKALEAGKSETLVEYLSMCARFHRYSFNNCVLIALQRPDATMVAGFNRWKELNRFVKKGEKGIAILAPMIRKRVMEDERQDGGKGAQEVRTLSGFRTVFVFDVSQTDGESLPEFATSHGEPGELIEEMETVIKERGITLLYQPIPGGANGCLAGDTITVRPDLLPSESFRVLVHETAHHMLHREGAQRRTTRTVRELEAEAVAFIVSSAFGIDSRTRSSDYIQLYAGDKEALMRSLDQVQKTATQVIEALHALRKERSHAMAT